MSFVTLSASGVRDAMGMQAQTPSPVNIGNCRHRPLRAEETPEYLTDVATQVWKTTAPPAALAAAAKSKTSGYMLEIIPGGPNVKYEIVGGPEPYKDFEGILFKVTIYSRIQVG
jgi:hypothetical protein